MEHRGACSCDNLTGDGAGILASIPHEFYKMKLKQDYNVDLPEAGQYYTGIVFMTHDTCNIAKEEFNKFANACGLEVKF